VQPQFYSYSQARAGITVIASNFNDAILTAADSRITNLTYRDLFVRLYHKQSCRKIYYDPIVILKIDVATVSQTANRKVRYFSISHSNRT
jgi:ribosome biogenesis GTPase A